MKPVIPPIRPVSPTKVSTAVTTSLTNTSSPVKHEDPVIKRHKSMKVVKISEALKKVKFVMGSKRFTIQVNFFTFFKLTFLRELYMQLPNHFVLFKEFGQCKSRSKIPVANHLLHAWLIMKSLQHLLDGLQKKLRFVSVCCGQIFLREFAIQMTYY